MTLLGIFGPKCGGVPGRRHEYEWICTMCGKWYQRRHWWQFQCHCGVSQLFQECINCGKRGPNGG